MSGDWTRFPTDDLNLRLLIEACTINEGTGRTHLDDFLHMGTRVASVEEGGVKYDTVDEALTDSLADVPVLYTEYEPGYEPHSPHTVIISLAEEIMRLRAQEPVSAGRWEELRSRAWVALAEGPKRSLRGHSTSGDRAPSGGFWIEVDPQDILDIVAALASAHGGRDE